MIFAKTIFVIFHSARSLFPAMGGAVPSVRATRRSSPRRAYRWNSPNSARLALVVFVSAIVFVASVEDKSAHGTSSAFVRLDTAHDGDRDVPEIGTGGETVREQLAGFPAGSFLAPKKHAPGSHASPRESLGNSTGHSHHKKIHRKKCSPTKHPLMERCHYVDTHLECQSDDNVVHYLKLHYCTFGPGFFARLASHLTQVLLLVLFCSILAIVAEVRISHAPRSASLIAHTRTRRDYYDQKGAFPRTVTLTVYSYQSLIRMAERLTLSFIYRKRFFTPALTNVAKWLKMSDDVAGATLLSFGNGSPDVFTQIAALRNANADGISLGIGAALGSSFFVAAAVLPIVALVASGKETVSGNDEGATAIKRNGVRVERWPFARDSTFYLLAVASTVATLVRGHVTRGEACMLLSVYAVYILVVLLPGRIGLPKTGNASAPPREAPDEFHESDTRVALLESAAGETDDAFEDAEDQILVDVTAIDARHGSPTNTKGLLKKLSEVAKAPILFALTATMPEVGVPLGSRSRWAISILPVTAPLFFASVARFLSDGVVTGGGVAFGLACGGLGSVLVYTLWPSVVVGSGSGEGGGLSPAWSFRLDLILTTVTFAQSVMWMDFTAGELVGLFGALGRVFGVSESLLGATVFAWGISVSDLASDMAIAKRGFPNTAIAACFGGPLFNVLVGLCGSLVVATTAHGTIHGIRVENAVLVLAACQLVGVVYLVVGIPTIHGGKITRKCAWGLLTYYAAAQVRPWGFSKSRHCLPIVQSNYSYTCPYKTDTFRSQSQAVVALTAGDVLFAEPWM